MCGHVVEVAPKCFQSVAFAFNFALRAHAQTSEDWNRRAPALKRVLGEETENPRRKQQEFPIDGNSQRHPEQDDDGSVGLQNPFNVPLMVKGAQAAFNFGGRRTLDLVGLNDADLAFGRTSREDALRSADWLAIFPGILARTPLAAPIAERFTPRTSFEIPLEQYTVCPCPEQTELRIYERNTER